MSESHSDALVFFGATGDLAYKKIFPALQAMVKRGRLDVPVIGVAKAGWTIDQLRRGRATASRNTADSIPRPLTNSAACCAMWTAITTTRPRSRRFATNSGRPSARPIISPFRPRCSAWSWSSSPSRAAPGRPRHRRKAVRPRPRIGARSQPDPAARLSTRTAIFRIDHYLGQAAGA